MSPSPSLPPELPTRSLTPVLLAAVGGLALVVLLWRLTRSASDAPELHHVAQTPAATVASKPVPAPLSIPDPPPPPPPPEEAAPSVRSALPPAGPAPAKPELTPKVQPLKRDPNCDDPCVGKETPELLTAIGAKAGQARSCYEKALSNDSALAGRLEVGVRVSRTGSACSVSVGKDGLGNASVTSCVLARFRGGKYPQPTGGCVDVSVPMNFMPAGSR
jgi:hypothetical protein